MRSLSIWIFFHFFHFSFLYHIISLLVSTQLIRCLPMYTQWGTAEDVCPKFFGKVPSDRPIHFLYHSIRLRMQCCSSCLSHRLQERSPSRIRFWSEYNSNGTQKWLTKSSIMTSTTVEASWLEATYDLTHFLPNKHPTLCFLIRVLSFFCGPLPATLTLFNIPLFYKLR